MRVSFLRGRYAGWGDWGAESESQHGIAQEELPVLKELGSTRKWGMYRLWAASKEQMKVGSTFHSTTSWWLCDLGMLQVQEPERSRGHCQRQWERSTGFLELLCE